MYSRPVHFFLIKILHHVELKIASADFCTYSMLEPCWNHTFDALLHSQYYCSCRLAGGEKPFLTFIRLLQHSYYPPQLPWSKSIITPSFTLSGDGTGATPTTSWCGLSIGVSSYQVPSYHAATRGGRRAS
jgi:hypothetical protein